MKNENNKNDYSFLLKPWFIFCVGIFLWITFGELPNTFFEWMIQTDGLLKFLLFVPILAFLFIYVAGMLFSFFIVVGIWELISSLFKTKEVSTPGKQKIENAIDVYIKTPNKEVGSSVTNMAHCEEVLPPESFFSTPRKIDWDTINETRKLHGDLGEMFVYDLEINYLTKAGRPDLAEKVKHVASEGDGHGYDIKSFYADGREKFIEVKATNASSGSTFNMSKNEFNFLKTHLNNAVVYHVHNVNNERETTVIIYPASSVINSPNISPSSYVVKM